MPEETPVEEPEGAPPEGTETPPGEATAELGDAGKQAIDRMKAERNAARAEAKKAQKELDELQRAHMTDQEKALEEARTAARAEALAEVGTKIAAAEFKAAAAGRFDDDKLSTLLAGLDLKAFLDDAGDVDPEKVRTFVDSIAPAPSDDTSDQAGDLLAALDGAQGARGTPGLGTTAFERDLRRTLGIR